MDNELDTENGRAILILPRIWCLPRAGKEVGNLLHRKARLFTCLPAMARSSRNARYGFTGENDSIRSPICEVGISVAVTNQPVGTLAHSSAKSLSLPAQSSKLSSVGKSAGRSQSSIWLYSDSWDSPLKKAARSPNTFPFVSLQQAWRCDHSEYEGVRKAGILTRT